MTDTVSIPPIPVHIYEQGQSVFGSENSYRILGDQLDMLLEDLQPASQSSTPHRASSSSGHLFSDPCLALITIMQHQERLTDLQASNALRSRLDWKYALHLPVLHMGIDERRLCAFRSSLHHSYMQRQAFQAVLQRVAGTGIFPALQAESSCETLLGVVCLQNRIDWAVQALSMALSAAAAIDSEWLRQHSLPQWYARNRKTGALLRHPATLEILAENFRSVGNAIQELLETTRQYPFAATASSEFRLLQQVFNQQFVITPEGQLSARPHCNFC